jgi:hypothetical protein
VLIWLLHPLEPLVEPRVLRRSSAESYVAAARKRRIQNHRNQLMPRKFLLSAAALWVSGIISVAHACVNGAYDHNGWFVLSNACYARVNVLYCTQSGNCTSILFAQYGAKQAVSRGGVTWWSCRHPQYPVRRGGNVFCQ